MNAPGLGLLDICRHHFAADFHSARPVFEVIITELRPTNPSQILHTYAAKLLSTCTGSNLTAATRLLLHDESAPPNLLEHCLEGRDSSLRLEVIFRLRRLGGIYFDLEIEEYILTREQLDVQLQMAAIYRRETGRGWSLYPSLLEQWSGIGEQKDILFSAASSQWKELTGLLTQLSLPAEDKNIALAWLGNPPALETLSQRSRQAGKGEQRLELIRAVMQSMEQIQAMDPHRPPSEDLALVLLQDLLEEQYLEDHWWPILSRLANMNPALSLVDPLVRLLPGGADPWLLSLRARATRRTWLFPTADELIEMPVWAIQALLDNAIIHPPVGGCDGLTTILNIHGEKPDVFSRLLSFFQARNPIKPDIELRQIFRQRLLRGECPTTDITALGIGCARLQEAGEFTRPECTALYRLFPQTDLENGITPDAA